MKILLISPAVNAAKRTNKGLRMPQLALYIIEGLTPAKHEVKVVEEEADIGVAKHRSERDIYSLRTQQYVPF